MWNCELDIIGATMKKLITIKQVLLSAIAIAIISLCAAQATDEVLCKTVDDDSSTGICVALNQLRDCPPLYTLLKSRNFTALRQSFCEGNEDIDNIKVCCSLDSYTERRPAEPVEDYSQHPNFKLLPHPDTSSCGVSASSSDERIIGGKNAMPGDFPWMVRVGIAQEEDEIDFACGGSIINQRYILTSAHCLKSGNKLETIRLAETDANVEEDCVLSSQVKLACSKVQDYGYDEVVIHPGYTGLVGSVNDIALIRLNKDIVNLTSYFTRPVCLPFIKEYGVPSLEDRIIQAKKGTITGWGKTSNHGSPEGSHILQYLFVPIKPNAACRVAYPTNNITYSQICAGGTKKDVCLGDSGSPLTYPGFTKKGKTLRSYQIGIVSFGRQKCAIEDIPVVYTRVRSYLKWILDNIRE